MSVDVILIHGWVIIRIVPYYHNQLIMLTSPFTTLMIASAESL